MVCEITYVWSVSSLYTGIGFSGVNLTFALRLRYIIFRATVRFGLVRLTNHRLLFNPNLLSGLFLLFELGHSCFKYKAQVGI